MSYLRTDCIGTGWSVDDIDNIIITKTPTTVSNTIAETIQIIFQVFLVKSKHPLSFLIVLL